MSRVKSATRKDLKTLTHQRHMMCVSMHPQTDWEMEVHDRAFASWALEEMRGRHLYCFLAIDGLGKAVAGGSVWLREVQPLPGRPGGRFPYLMSMYTEPEFRRRGLATMIVNHALSWARHNGYDYIELDASKMGFPIYAKLGFERNDEVEMIKRIGTTRSSSN